DEFGFLSESFNAMADSVMSQMGIQEASAEITDTMVKAKALDDFRKNILKKLVEVTDSNMGAYFLHSPENNTFEHFTSIGISPEILEPFDASILEGELGQALETKRISHTKNIPGDTLFKFKTFTGTALPREIITIPIVTDGVVVSIISLANLKVYSQESLEIVNQVWTGMNTGVSNLVANEKTRKLAEELEGKNQELQAQTEELQSQAEELQQQSEELQEQNVELEAQREQVEEANRLKSEFLSNMSHELRTPLNSVMALSRVLLMQAKDKLSEEELNYLEIIQRNGQNLLSLINDILDLSKIEAGKMDVTPKLFSITSTIETIMERLEPVAEEKGIDMNQEIPDNLPQIESDEARVHQILQNLMGNALKFTDQGSVTVSARSDTEKIYIRVADTGIGISAKDLSNIFQEFRQVDGTSARPYEGTGLGLAIAHKAAKMLGGDLTVQSALGKGSTFTLILPVKWSGLIPDSRPFAVTTPGQITPAQKTVLVVDDEPDVLTMISEYLSLEGYNILTATSGEKALRLAREHRPFAITLDVIMPEMDGWEVLQELKKQPETANIPVIIVSVSDDKETGFALGAVGYVTKPVNRDLLIGEINRIDGPTPHTIMVVDDNEIERKEMASIIEEEGMKALVAEDGKRCMDMIQESLPDVLVLDLIMPDVDGFEVLDRVRSDPETKNLPVIVVTAKDLTTEDRERLSGNVSSVLAKGDTTSKTLLEELKKLLSDIERPAEYLQAEKIVPGNRILLVEDNEAAVIQVKSILESDGYVVDVAGGGEEALEYVEQTIPDGIILDLMMPHVDGFEVLEKLRSSKATAMIPVLVLTAKDLTREDIEKLTANNIQQLVQKGDVDREGLVFKTRLMLGVEARVKFETGNLKLETKKPQLATRNLKPVTRNSQPTTILVVEDNPDNMTTIKAILKGAYNILEATDGEEGLNMALKELPDLILLDMSLPKMDGFEVVRQIKSKSAARHIPVIALTARAMKGDRERTIEAGCDDYVSKPVDPEEVLGKIGEWVKI
ncbi:MAG: response regulator, partial [Deltaproteobacteria bacterium]|nr:response regulator [Deltaproteobacteria bacterium]